MPGGVIEREFIDRRCDRSFGRRTPHAKSAHCVIACVEVQPVSLNGPSHLDPEILGRLAMQRIERCLRPDDLICLLGGGRLAVCFGHGADRATGAALGLRLASAMGDHFSVGGQVQDLEVSVGIGTGTSTSKADVAFAASAASRAGRRLLRARQVSTNGNLPSTRVVVARVRGASGQHLQRREVLTKAHGYEAHSQNGSASRNGATATTPGDLGQHRTSDMSVIIVGPELADPTRADPAVEALLGAARGTGVFPTLVATPDVGSVLEHYVRNRNELVVLALGSETALRNISTGPATPWERWAHLARDFGRVGATVLAVGVGASVAAIAMCVREGAVGVLDLGEFAEQLEKMSVNLASRRLAAESGARETSRGSARGGLPNPYNRLVDLTASEHRVLYQMMRGVSASEIAEELVVSLATVRSHIRSILRKLQVSSQLAAVALANGVRPDVIEPV